MSTLLQINASLFSGQGQSSQLTQRFTEVWRRKHPAGQVIERDLAQDPIPHLTAERFAALLAPPETRTLEQQAVVEAADVLVNELRLADFVVLGLPMYNFGVPSTLKAYFDHLARAGVSFRYTQEGPVGLLADRPVFVLATRGGQYRGTAKDTQSQYVSDFFQFLGIKDIHFVYAEGLNMGEETKTSALLQAEQQIKELMH